MKENEKSRLLTRFQAVAPQLRRLVVLLFLVLGGWFWLRESVWDESTMEDSRGTTGFFSMVTGSAVPRRRALILYAVHLCSQSFTAATEWSNMAWFLRYGLLQAPIGNWSRIDYIFVTSDIRLTRLTQLYRHGNIRLVALPKSSGDLHLYGELTKQLADKEEWFSCYDRFIFLNSGTRGPLQRAGLPKHQWLDDVSSPTQYHTPEDVVIGSTVSWAITLHLQSYFLSCTRSTAYFLLTKIYNFQFGDYRQVIDIGEVGGSQSLLTYGYVFYDLSLRRFFDKCSAEPFEGRRFSPATKARKNSDPYRTVFQKFGGYEFSLMPKSYRDLVASLTGGLYWPREQIESDMHRIFHLNASVICGKSPVNYT